MKRILSAKLKYMYKKKNVIKTPILKDIPNASVEAHTSQLGNTNIMMVVLMMMKYRKIRIK